jgi:UDP-glucose 4-epimerase
MGGEKRIVMTDHQGLRGRRILITGGAGYLATTIVSVLTDVKCTVVRLDRAEGKFPGVEGEAETVDITADIREGNTWNDVLGGVDIVLHLAAQTSVYTAKNDPIQDWGINVQPMISLLEACRKHDHHPVVVFAGTATEWGIPQKLPVDESFPDSPLTVYDVHKCHAESYLRYYAQKGVVSGITLRLANVYGPGPKTTGKERGVINMMVGKALRGEALTLYEGGRFIRDYVYVRDVAEAFVQAALSNRIHRGEKYVIGRGEGNTIGEAARYIAEEAMKRTGKSVALHSVPSPAGLEEIEKRDFVSDPGAFSSLTGWHAETGLRDGIVKTIEYYLGDNPS